MIKRNKEIWKPIPEFLGRYEVSSLGRVRAVRSNKILLLTKAHGYLTVHLSKSLRINRLVLETFTGRTDKIAHHINYDKADNRLSNLKWMSFRQHEDAHPKCTRGSNHPNAKLTERDILKILEMKYMNQKQVGAMFGVGQAAIGAILSGRGWKHVPRDDR